MTEQDIISINYLIEICANNINIGTQNENTENKDKNKEDGITSKSEYWNY